MSIQPKPRQPMTKKRRGAIEAYAVQKTYKHPAVRFVVDAVLKAEKMPAEELYQWLTANGWRWQYGAWGKLAGDGQVNIKAKGES